MADRDDAEVALAAAAAGADVVARWYGRALARYAKGPGDLATEADLAAEDAIRAVIRAARPADTVVGEERGVVSGPAPGRRWLVDPLCGTQNYAASTPLACVNVALETAGGVPVAVCADPLSGEYFWKAGTAAWVRREGVDVPSDPTPRSGLVDVNCDGEGRFVGPQLLADPEFRSRFGGRVLSTALALAWVAAGRRAAYVTDGRQLRTSVHFAAGIAVCEAAGCVVTDLSGGPVGDGRGLVAAADRATHTLLLSIAGRHR